MIPRASRVARLLAAAELPAVLLVAPALLFPTPARLLVLAVVPLTWFGARLTSGRWIPATPLNVVLGVLLAMVGVSIFATTDVTASLGKIAGVVLGVIFYWAVVRWAADEARLRVMLWAFVGAGAALAVIGLLGVNWSEKFPVFGAVLARLPRMIRGVPGAAEGFHPNAVAGCLALFVPLQAALCWRDVFGHRHNAAPAFAWRDAIHASAPKPASTISSRGLLFVHAPLFALTTATLLLTQSRGAWAGLAVAALAFLMYHGRRTRLVALALVAAAAVTAVLIGPEGLVNLAISQSGPGMAGNIAGRLELWSRAIYGIQDFPITGMGMNMFRQVMPILYPAFLMSPDFDFAHAHNHLLQAALDLGLPGLIAYLALWIVVGVMLVRVDPRADDPDRRTIAGGLGAGLLAHFSFSMTDAIPLGAKVGILFWFTIAFVTALHAAASRSASSSRTTPRG